MYVHRRMHGLTNGLHFSTYYIAKAGAIKHIIIVMVCKSLTLTSVICRDVDRANKTFGLVQLLPSA